MFVKCPDDQTVSVILSPADCVKGLKKKLERLTGINLKWQQVSIDDDDVILEDDTQISDVEVEGDCNIFKLSTIPGKSWN